MFPGSVVWISRRNYYYTWILIARFSRFHSIELFLSNNQISVLNYFSFVQVVNLNFLGIGYPKRLMYNLHVLYVLIRAESEAEWFFSALLFESFMKTVVHKIRLFALDIQFDNSVLNERSIYYFMRAVNLLHKFSRRKPISEFDTTRRHEHWPPHQHGL